MKRFASLSSKAIALLGALTLTSFVVACDEDGKTAPERCSLPPPVDIQNAGAPSDDNRSLNPGSGGENGLPPCVTEVGHAVSSYGTAGDGTGGTSTADAGAGGT